ncbi:hypothetical protein TNCV_2548641 [Trichonephila clavipes]|nr:hypothetical protein TNCV_2548641 [Trichonephila clavipes]
MYVAQQRKRLSNPDLCDTPVPASLYSACNGFEQLFKSELKELLKIKIARNSSRWGSSLTYALNKIAVKMAASASSNASEMVYNNLMGYNILSRLAFQFCLRPSTKVRAE